MSIDIKYKIEFFTDWHCSSGLAAGSDIDLLVIKDKDKLPYIPGKTIKGLVREAIEDILMYRERYVNDINFEKSRISMLGEGTDSVLAKEKNYRRPQKGEAYFTNANLSEGMKESVLSANLTSYMYRSITSTAIKNGVAMNHSLRKMQTTLPCELYGEIHDVDPDFADVIVDALRSIKRLGYNRNRGLGRCQFTILEGGNK